jgi:hypothetical protein
MTDIFPSPVAYAPRVPVKPCSGVKMSWADSRPIMASKYLG